MPFVSVTVELESMVTRVALTSISFFLVLVSILHQLLLGSKLVQHTDVH